jgi:hypothetical protein
MRALDPHGEERVFARLEPCGHGRSGNDTNESSMTAYW